MRSFSLRSSLVLATLAVLSEAWPTSNTKDHDLFVKIDTIAIQGRLSNVTDTVRFFGNIPYAEPPIGNLRWRSPSNRTASRQPIDGTDFGPSCIQLNTGSRTVYTEYLSGFLLRPGQPTSEDCLTVNVWTPRAAAISKPLPVMIFIHGGGFTSGGAASPYKYGDYLVRDHQDVIVVAINYRVNIFGFPGAAALGGKHLNPGLEDQRKAVEWLYDNIHAFGGDPNQLTLFGQSAGGSSVDKCYYAYPDNPLIQGCIPQSGMADSGIGPASTEVGSNFSYVASQLGCSQSDASAQFSCLQQVPANTIIQFLNKYNATQNGGRSLSFTPQADNLTSFADYEALRQAGRFARKPSIISQVNDEGSSLLPYNGPDKPPSQTAIDAFTCNFATFPDDKGAAARQKFGLPVWRTRYLGEWANLNPLPWLGSYHSSDLPMIFGTHELRGPSTDLEKATSAYYQGAWVTFAKDPVNGLNNYGWPEYDAMSGDNLIQLGLNGSVQAVIGSNKLYEDHCNSVLQG